MIKVYQNIFGDRGNCFSACLASILEVPIDRVPNFHGEHGINWLRPVADWLKPFGLLPLVVSLERSDDQCREFLTNCDALHIAGGLSAFQGSSHACVYRGSGLVHDPSPGCEGLRFIEDMTFLVPIAGPAPKFVAGISPERDWKEQPD